MILNMFQLTGLEQINKAAELRLLYAAGVQRQQKTQSRTRMLLLLLFRTKQSFIYYLIFHVSFLTSISCQVYHRLTTLPESSLLFP